MFLHISKWHFFITRSILALSLLSTASYGQRDQPSTTPTDSYPKSLEQTLVPESVFAMQLAEALKLGPVSDEANAIELLSDLEIEPKNGWIAEFPVTPDVLGDIETKIAKASEQGKIAFTKDQALDIFNSVRTHLGFDVKPGIKPPAKLSKKTGKTKVYMYTDNQGVTHYTDDHNSIPKGNLKNVKVISQLLPKQISDTVSSNNAQPPVPKYTAQPDTEILDEQYEEQGPPVVTYYAPPDSYNYLYSWVPYPFWSAGAHFPGFFVLNDFHRRIFFKKRPYDVAHHHGKSTTFHRSHRPPPVSGSFHGKVQSDGMNQFHGFSTPKAQAGAKAIVGGNINRNRLPKGATDSRWDYSRKPFPSTGNPRTFNQPSFDQRNHVPSAPRSFSSPTFSQENDTRSSSRPYEGNGAGGFQRNDTFQGYQGNRNFSGHGGGHSSGFTRGGHR